MRLIRKLLGLSILIILAVDISMVSMIPAVNVALADPATYIYVDPALVTGTPPGSALPKIFVNVTDAPSTYSWEIRLEWDSNLLNLSRVTETEFLKRDMYTTSFQYTPLDEANLNGEIVVSCSLQGDVPWASGNGGLCWFGFKVKAASYGSTLLNLEETRLADHTEGDPPYPAYTYYPNNDGFFYNAATPIHDIRVSHVTAFDTSVHLGEVARINVTVLNEGTVTDTCDIYVYADIDTAIIGDEITIAHSSQSLSGSGNSEARSFIYEVLWDTTGCSKVGYTISAYVLPVIGEGDTTDNTRIDGVVWIRKMIGDVDGDDDVDTDDLSLFSEAYGSMFGGDCDFNVDAKVDIYDLFLLGRAYG